MSLVSKAVQRMSGSSWFPKVAPKIVPRLDLLVHRLTRGRTTLTSTYRPALLLTAVGAKTGRPRTVPLMTIPEGEHLYLVASNYGRERHPAWSANLIAHPEATVDYRGEVFEAHAHLLSAQEKEQVWPLLLKRWPLYDRYEERSGRDLRVFRLERPA